MSRIKLDFKALKPLADSAGKYIAKSGKAIGTLVNNREFQKGVATAAIPSGISLFFLIRKKQKEAAEKESLYKEKLRKHNAIVKQLSSEAEIAKKRQDRLLAYDSKLKTEMSSLESEIEDLKRQIAELKEGKNEQV